LGGGAGGGLGNNPGAHRGRKRKELKRKGKTAGYEELGGESRKKHVGQKGGGITAN